MGADGLLERIALAERLDGDDRAANLTKARSAYTGALAAFRETGMDFYLEISTESLNEGVKRANALLAQMLHSLD